jgi:Fe-S oxidoreductase
VRKVKEPVTFHDPCNIIRGRGLMEEARYVMRELCEDFREMWPNREYNYCCNAGGDTVNCGPPWKKYRCDSNKVKAEQLERTGAKIVVTPCHNCHSGMEDIVGYYKLGMHVKFINELLIDCIEIPEALKV